jgi:hypothetical protein
VIGMRNANANYWIERERERDLERLETLVVLERK